MNDGSESWLDRQLAVLATLLARLESRFRPPPPEPDDPFLSLPTAKPFQITFAPLNNDVEMAWTRALAGLLDGNNSFSYRFQSAALPTPVEGDQALLVATIQRARQILLRDDDLDFVIWGDVHEDGYTLWLTHASGGDDDRPGAFGSSLKIDLAGDQTDATGGVLSLILLAAADAKGDDQKMMLRRVLPQTLHQFGDLPRQLPVNWTIDQQRSALVCWAHAAATEAGLGGDLSWYDHAADAYRRAIQRLPRHAQGGIEEAQLRRHLALALQAWGDRKHDGDLLEQAVVELRAVADCVPRAVYPQEWGNAQNKLGVALFRLDELHANNDLLKEAMTAHHAALSAFPRAEQPQRWAEVMSNLAQVMQVYGDQVKSPEVLKRAVDSCRAALDMRDKDRAPLAWASTQATLGSALFLLAKHTQGVELLDESAAAFQEALEIFRFGGAVRQAAVAERNLAHVRRLMKIRGERKVASPDWSEAIEKPPAA